MTENKSPEFKSGYEKATKDFLEVLEELYRVAYTDELDIINRLVRMLKEKGLAE